MVHIQGIGDEGEDAVGLVRSIRVSSFDRWLRYTLLILNAVVIVLALIIIYQLSNFDHDVLVNRRVYCASYPVDHRPLDCPAP